MKSFFITIIIACIATTSLINAQTSFAYKLKIGDHFKVSKFDNQDIAQDMNGQKHEMNNRLEGEFTFIVEEITDSLFGLKFKFDRFKMVSTSNLIGEILSINTNNSIADDDDDDNDNDDKGKKFA
jgi:hypothetical protein